MQNLSLFLLIFLAISSLSLAQATLTQPTLGAGGGVIHWQGLPIDVNAAYQINLGVGMWRFAPGQVEWTTGLDYQRAQGNLATFEVGNSGNSLTTDWTSHRLHWTTLAIWHLSKPYLNLQVGGFVGVGLGGTTATGLFLDEEARLPLAWLSERGDFSYGPVLGLGGGTRLLQFHLRYVWDLYDYLPPANLRLRRPFLALGLTFVVPGVEIY